MKKKFVSILLIPVIAVSLVACGSTNSQRSSIGSEKTAEQAEEAAKQEEEAQRRAAALASLGAATKPNPPAASSSSEVPAASATSEAPAASTTSESPAASTSSEAPETSNTPQPSTAPEYPSVVDGIAVSFRKSIPNDVTGKWRVAVVIDDTSDPNGYLVDFYNAYIKDPSEVFAIVNKKLKTTIRVNNFLGGWLDVAVLEYQNGEEVDAKKLFSGKLLDNYLINKETGEIDPLEE